MDLRDIKTLKELIEKYELGNKLTDKEEILKEKVNTLLAFEEINNKFVNDKKEFQIKMEELNKKAGE